MWVSSFFAIAHALSVLFIKFRASLNKAKYVEQAAIDVCVDRWSNSQIDDKQKINTL